MITPSEISNQVITTNTTNDLFSEEFVSNSVIRYLKENGYKISKENSSEKGEKIITASTFFKKEIIEVKGFPTEFYVNEKKGLHKNTKASQQAKHWFSNALFNSFINFSKYYNSDNIVIAMALPNAGRYKAIIRKVQEYFTYNNLYFKIYLVDENGDVEVSNLNGSFQTTK